VALGQIMSLYLGLLVNRCHKVSMLTASLYDEFEITESSGGDRRRHSGTSCTLQQCKLLLEMQTYRYEWWWEGRENHEELGRERWPRGRDTKSALHLPRMRSANRSAKMLGELNTHYRYSSTSSTLADRAHTCLHRATAA
jgi:hypothetical protein